MKLLILIYFGLGESTLDVDALISNALELSRSYRRMNSSSVNSTFNLLSNLSLNPRGGQKSQRLGGTKASRKDLQELDVTNKENMSTVEQSTLLLNNDDLVS